jgi:hypothetical protein
MLLLHWQHECHWLAVPNYESNLRVTDQDGICPGGLVPVTRSCVLGLGYGDHMARALEGSASGAGLL